MLEQKVFAAWLSYTLDRRRKTERYAQAMCRHRDALVILAVRQWITVSIDRCCQIVGHCGCLCVYRHIPCTVETMPHNC